MSLDHRHLKNFRSLVAGRNLFENEEDKLQVGVGYDFLTGVVQDVISNPYEFLNRNYGNTEFKLKDVLSGRIQQVELDSRASANNNGNTNGQNVLDRPNISPNTPSLSFINPQVIETMPMNSIFAYIIDDNQSKDDPKLTVCYPFFPPHLSLPLKAGEYVWIICENVKGVKYYYWMCRKVGSLQIDDLNYTNMERIPAVNDILEEQATQQGTSDIDYNSAYSLDEVEDILTNQTNKKSNMPISLSDIMRTSYSYNTEFTGEPVPRLAKDCSDIVLQGSNNGGLHITTEKFDDINKDEADEFYVGSGEVGTSPPPFRKPLAPAIDLFVGRKINSLNDLKAQTSSTLNSDSKINTTANNSRNSFYNYVENDKMLDSKNSDPTVYSSELNDDSNDATDVAARLYMSNKCSVDLNFESEFDVLESYHGPSIVTYAQHNRMIGASDVRLVSQSGQSFIDMDPEGNVVAKASINDGQQFLSLGADGITRLQAKSGGKILLGVRNGSTPKSAEGMEAYVLVSQLEEFIEDIGLILGALASGVVSASTSTVPTAAAVQSAIQTLGIAELALPGGDIYEMVMKYNSIGRKLRSKKIFGEKE